MSSAFKRHQMRVSKRLQRLKARAAGLCAVCCYSPPQAPYKSCGGCLERGRERNRLVSELMQAYRREERAAAAS